MAGGSAAAPLVSLIGVRSVRSPSTLAVVVVDGGVTDGASLSVSSVSSLGHRSASASTGAAASSAWPGGGGGDGGGGRAVAIAAKSLSEHWHGHGGCGGMAGGRG